MSSPLPCVEAGAPPGSPPWWAPGLLRAHELDVKGQGCVGRDDKRAALSP